jgi:hypothetical protein
MGLVSSFSIRFVQIEEILHSRAFLVSRRVMKLEWKTTISTPRRLVERASSPPTAEVLYVTYNFDPSRPNPAVKEPFIY